MLPVVKSFQLGPNLGFFIADNAGPNDTAIRAILQDLDADIKDPDDRQVGCLGHIINLVAKAFLFGDDVESLEIHKDRSKAEIKELSWGQGRAGSTTASFVMNSSRTVLKGATNGFLLQTIGLMISVKVCRLGYRTIVEKT